MSERDLVLQLAKNIPEDKSLSQDSLENMGVKELHNLIRKCNAARNQGELNEQSSEWLVELESRFHKKIADVLKVGNHKVQLSFFSMVYTILNYVGCYVKGKNSNPIGITRVKYCSLLKLKDRLKSNNVRKTIASEFYAHDHMLTIARRMRGEKVNVHPTLKRLEPIYEEIAYDIKNNFFSTT